MFGHMPFLSARLLTVSVERVESCSRSPDLLGSRIAQFSPCYVVPLKWRSTNVGFREDLPSIAYGSYCRLPTCCGRCGEVLPRQSR